VVVGLPLGYDCMSKLRDYVKNDEWLDFEESLSELHKQERELMDKLNSRFPLEEGQFYSITLAGTLGIFRKYDD
jgi:hypothetical protein